MNIERQIFRQADFIQVAIGNVHEAIRDGTIWVCSVVPFSVELPHQRHHADRHSAVDHDPAVFRYFGVTINTMTLGGLAVAIGELVDDSIVDIENIYRRLKENRQNEQPDNPLKVIFVASGGAEVHRVRHLDCRPGRHAIVFVGRTRGSAVCRRWGWPTWSRFWRLCSFR